MQRTARLWALGALLSAALATAVPAAAEGPECGDRFLPYQLSYVESSQAVALLEAMDYETIRFKGQTRKDRPDGPPFQGQPKDKETILKNPARPLVIELLDSAMVSLSGLKAKTAEERLGGTHLQEVSTGIPQQRLLIVWDPCKSDRLKDLLKLLHEEIDVPAKQLLIEALLLELDQNLARELGFSFTSSKDGQTASFDFDRVGFAYVFKRPSPKTLLEFTGRIQALVSDGDATVLSRPSVLVLDGRQARIAVSDKVPYAVVKTTKIGENFTSDTEYLDTGIVLNLRPRATDDNSHISMQVEVKISGQSGESPTGIGPPLAARDVKTVVRIANNTPFIVGGLISRSESKGRAGIPWISKIPGIGRLFRRDVDLRDVKEVVVILVPHVIPPEDRAFSYSIAKDSDLFDQFGLELFRNVYRVRSDDVFDLDFIRASAFYTCLERNVESSTDDLTEAVNGLAEGSPAERLPGPVPPGDAAALAEALREWLHRDPALLAQKLRVTPRADVGEQRLRLEQLIRLLEGRIPGEDILVKRMLLGIVERLELGRFVKRDEIIFFEDKSEKPAGKDEAKRRNCPKELERGDDRAILEVERLATDLRCRQGKDFGLLFGTGRTSEGLLFDPPSARVEELPERIAAGHYRCETRKRTCLGADGDRWERLAILFDASDEVRDRLANVLVLKRVLDLNPTLPLTLEGFHVGLDVVFPAIQDLESRNHLVDTETARLFFETLDYYYAFELKMRAGLGSLVGLGLPEAPGCRMAENVGQVARTALDPECACGAAFTATVDEDEPLRVTFRDASVFDPTGWSWDFGNGEDSTDRNPEPQRYAPGTYTVRLRIDTPEGPFTTETVLEFDGGGGAGVSVGDLPASSLSPSPTSPAPIRIVVDYSPPRPSPVEAGGQALAGLSGGGPSTLPLPRPNDRPEVHPDDP